MHYHISCLMYYHICITSYHYMNHWFIYILCIFCMMNVVRMWQGNIVLRTISDATEEVHWMRLHRPREKRRPFQKEYRKEIFHLVLPHFSFWHAIEYVTTCPFRGVVKTIQNKSFKDNICSIGTSCAAVCLSSEAATISVLKKRCFKTSAKLTGKHLCLSIFPCPSFCSFWGNMVERDHPLTSLVEFHCCVGVSF